MPECTPRDARTPVAVSLPVLAPAAPPRRVAFGSRVGWKRAAVLAGVWVFMVAHLVQWLAMGSTLAPIEPSESIETVRNGVITVGAIFFAVALLSTALLGRWFCGWGCHWVAIQDGTAWMLARLGIRPRPFRSRLLAWLPLALALYMFAWPPFYRFAVAPWVQPDLRWPGWSVHLVTQDFWATFPGWLMGIPFVLVSGILVVWLLGTKGYCTYACPYGGFFAPVEQLAPMRIRVNHDRCEGCGHCTAVCTSNVRVHEEVRDYGMVVDQGCMKCMDCVSTCPNEALSFGPAKPAFLVEREGTRADQAAERRFDLTWPEEVALAAVALATLLAVRGAYVGVPLLFASGIAACVTFLCWKSWTVLREPNVSFHGWLLRRRGRMGAAGGAWLAATAVTVVLVAWVGSLNAATWAARLLDARVTVPAAAVFAEAGHEPTAAERTDAERALRLYRWAAAWPEGWSPFAMAWRRTDMERAYLLAVLRDFGGAEALLRRSWSRDGADEGVAIVLGRVLRCQPSRRTDAMAWYAESLAAHPAWRALREEQLVWLDGEGEYATLVASARDGMAAQPEDLNSMRRLSIALTERGATASQIEEGVALVRRTLEIEPGNAFAHVALARGLMKLGRVGEAQTEFRRAMELDPASEMIRSMAAEAQGMPAPTAP
jgi:ferredoxin/tetratricopeptide (TPR) repeat protein